jgi:Cof subfamily protein (haloacid dehalogenase superfamily)
MNLPEFAKLPGAIAIDLDGTLLNSKNRLSERNHNALEKCILRGIPVIIATGRPLRSVHRLMGDELTDRCSLVSMNGALAIGIFPLSGYIKEALTEEMIRGIIDTALKNDQHTRITIEIEGYEFATTLEGYDFAKKDSLDKETLWQLNSATPDMVVPLDEAIKRNPCKIALGRTDIVRLAEILEKQFGSELSIICSDITGIRANPLLNITVKTATKTEALRRLLTQHGITLTDVLAFGDDLPDLEMLQACGIPVAMANASLEVKADCLYHTAGNDEDGVAVVLEKMLGECL